MVEDSEEKRCVRALRPPAAPQNTSHSTLLILRPLTIVNTALLSRILLSSPTNGIVARLAGLLRFKRFHPRTRGKLGIAKESRESEIERRNRKLYYWLRILERQDTDQDDVLKWRNKPKSNIKAAQSRPPRKETTAQRLWRVRRT